MTLGSSSGTNTINIGTGAGATAVNIGSNNTGAVNIGTSANAKTITIGNTTGATALNLNTGTGGFTAVTGTTGNISITSGTTGTVTLDSGTTGAVNIGTNANSKAVTIGNVTGTSTLSLQAGSGGIIMPTASLGAVVTGNFTLCRNGTTGRLFIGASQTQCNPSSARYKHDIVDIALGLDTVRALRPVAYTYNENNELSLGFIAEELFLIDPRLVVLDDQGLPNAIDTDRILPILTKGIQEVDLTVTALQTTVASLQTTVTDNYNALTIQDANLLNLYNLLESRVAGLETRVNALESNGIDKTVVGEATVLTGATEVVVTFATPMTGVPVVQVTPSGENFLLSNLKYTVTDRTVNGFKIKIDFAQLEDFAFGWSAKAP